MKDGFPIAGVGLAFFPPGCYNDWRKGGEPMIAEFTERRPVLSTVLVVLLFTVVPGAFMLIAALVSGGEFNSAGVVFVYALILQLILWLKVERPILIILPFIMALLGFIVSEIVYTVSQGMNPVGQGPGVFALLFSSAVVTLFGAEGAGNVGGLILYAIIVIIKKVRELIVYR